MKNWKCLNLGPKMSYFVIFGPGIWKQYCHIWNNHPRIYQIGKFCKKMKMQKFGTNNALFGYILVRILKNYCHIWN